MTNETPSILIIDDDELVRKALLRAFALTPWHAVSAGCGAQGVSLFTQFKQSLRLVVTDHIMPGKHGIEVAQEVSESSSVPVILMSANLPQPVLQRVEQLPRVHFLPKPFQFAELLQKAQELIG